MSPGISTGNYEVFLSCRGPDTRTHFVDCLYEFMRDAGIRVFTDDGQLSFGETLGETLKSTVDCAKIFMPILSKTYAHSAWCLTELDYAVNHWKPNLKGKKIIPVFYDVTPNDVKLKYSEDLEKHEKKFGTDQVQKWKKALQEVASMKGWKPEETR